MTDTNEKKRTESKLDELTKEVVGIGMMWAKHGLAIGRSALETSAKTLHATAKLLGDVADSLDGKKPKEEGPAQA